MARELFGESRLPTLVQYDPRSRYFETQEGTLLFSGNNGVPLLRYHIADTGGREATLDTAGGIESAVSAVSWPAIIAGASCRWGRSCG